MSGADPALSEWFAGSDSGDNRVLNAAGQAGSAESPETHGSALEHAATPPVPGCTLLWGRALKETNSLFLTEDTTLCF